MQNLRNFCFTINNYEKTDLDAVMNLDYKYIVVGFEESATGTPHLQGYCELSKQTKFTTIKKLLPRAHIEARRGTAYQAAEYCKKTENFIEEGEISMPGKRNDLALVRDLAETGGLRLVTRSGNLQQIRVAEKYLQYHELKRNTKPFVTWLWGESGSGKSRMAYDLFRNDDYFRKNTGTKWWCGYDGHTHVILDDFRGSWWDFTYMLGLIDRYSFTVETKGGSRQFLATDIIITSAYHPREVYPGVGEDIEQLLRRIDIIEQLFKKILVPDPVPVPGVGGNTKPLPPDEEVETFLKSLIQE